MSKKNNQGLSTVTGFEEAPHAQGRDLVNQLLGQTQMASTLSMFSQTVAISKLAIVKESKLYQQLKGVLAPNGLELSGTWGEFCGLLGVSDEKANQDIANFRTFGEEALEQMQRVGIGYRELRSLRKLPEDEQTALIDVAKSGDKDQLIDFAEAVIAKHAKEKAELAIEIDQLQSDKANLSVDSQKYMAERDSLAKQLKRRSQSEEDSGVPIVVLDIRAEAAALVKKAELALTSIYPLGVELAGLRGHDLAGPWVEPSTRLVLSGLVALRLQLDGLIGSYADAINTPIASDKPDGLSFLTPEEIQAVAKEWAELTALHSHEAALRQHDRDAARPRGKGRPASAPQLKA